jgi:hypothetical protein
LAFLVFLIVFILLYITTPPFVRQTPKHDMERPPRSLTKILIWSLVASLLVLIYPSMCKCLGSFRGLSGSPSSPVVTCVNVNP